ncbi:MAG: hypothetical protein IPN53_17470 [Comamonadaceae bacterium]|nr:hypothetical protein [Comamonadaceae bacterium]
MNLVDEFLRFAAHHADFESYVAKRIADDQKAVAAFAQKERDRMVQLTARSIAARRAKKAETKQNTGSE